MTFTGKLQQVCSLDRLTEGMPRSSEVRLFAQFFKGRVNTTMSSTQAVTSDKETSDINREHDCHHCDIFGFYKKLE